MTDEMTPQGPSGVMPGVGYNPQFVTQDILAARRNAAVAATPQFQAQEQARAQQQQNELANRQQSQQDFQARQRQQEQQQQQEADQKAAGLQLRMTEHADNMRKQAKDAETKADQIEDRRKQEAAIAQGRNEAIVDRTNQPMIRDAARFQGAAPDDSTALLADRYAASVSDAADARRAAATDTTVPPLIQPPSTANELLPEATLYQNRSEVGASEYPTLIGPEDVNQNIKSAKARIEQEKISAAEKQKADAQTKNDAQRGKLTGAEQAAHAEKILTQAQALWGADKEHEGVPFDATTPEGLAVVQQAAKQYAVTLKATKAALGIEDDGETPKAKAAPKGAPDISSLPPEQQQK